MKRQHWLTPAGQYTSRIIAVKSQFVLEAKARGQSQAGPEAFFRKKSGTTTVLFRRTKAGRHAAPCLKTPRNKRATAWRISRRGGACVPEDACAAARARWG